MNELATIDEIKKHLANLDLDIRKSGNGRWIDQKVTPDVLCLTAESILSHMENSKIDTFTMRSLWDDPQYSEATKTFNKPDVDNNNARNEYDKLISQPCSTLAYAQVIGKKPDINRNIYCLNSDTSILRFIAHRSDNAYKFLCLYIQKVLQDSGLWDLFDNFYDLGGRSVVSSSDYHLLKDSFSNFLIEYTKINGITETRRIFTKVINPLAAKFNVKGTKGGHLSPHSINFSDLLYNQINFRDINKEKKLTRQEADELINKTPSFGYEINKATKQISRHHNSSEMDDEINYDGKTEVHHIFMKHEKPQLAAHLENLINLTPNQHRSKAHPGSNFNTVDPEYQKLCLFKKCNAVEESEAKNDSFYNKEKLIEVVNIGFDEPLLEIRDTYQAIKDKLNNFYMERFKVAI